MGSRSVSIRLNPCESVFYSKPCSQETTATATDAFVPVPLYVI